MKEADKKTWITETRCKCFNAIRTIRSSKKQSATTHNIRLRKIAAFEEMLYVHEVDSGQLELFEPQKAVSPEIAELLDNPTLGL